MRTLRAKVALRGTVHSEPYIRLGLKKLGVVVEMINSDLAFDQRAILLKLGYPLLKLIRLADSYGCHMDKVWYLVIETEKHILACVPQLNDPNIFPEQVDEVPEVEEEEGQDEVLPEDVPVEYGSDEESASEEVVLGTQQVLEENLDVDPESFGGRIIHIWNYHKSKFDTYYARCGYMLSVVPEVYEHAIVSETVQCFCCSQE